MDIISTNLENINAALDTDYWNGGQMFLGAINEDFKAAIFSGNSNECEIETAEIEGFPGARTNIQGVRPIVDAEATVTVKTRERLADTETESSSSSMVDSGINPVRQSGRYIRANVKIPSKTTFTEPSSLISQPVSLSDHFAFHFDKSVPSNNTIASSGGAESDAE